MLFIYLKYNSTEAIIARYCNRKKRHHKYTYRIYTYIMTTINKNKRVKQNITIITNYNVNIFNIDSVSESMKKSKSFNSFFNVNDILLSGDLDRVRVKGDNNTQL